MTDFTSLQDNSLHHLLHLLVNEDMLTFEMLKNKNDFSDLTNKSLFVS